MLDSRVLRFTDKGRVISPFIFLVRDVSVSSVSIYLAFHSQRGHFSTQILLSKDIKKQRPDFSIRPLYKLFDCH